MNCQYCDRPAHPYTCPALCDWHFDLAMLAEYILDQRRAVTVESVQAELDRCLKNGGTFIITQADIPALMSQPFASQVWVTE